MKRIRSSGALKRGYQPELSTSSNFGAVNTPMLQPCCCRAVCGAPLDEIATQAIGAGIHLHANTDLPGQFNSYLETNADWIALMSSLFGLDVTSAVPGWDSSVT
jgi:hypothetical protein